MLFRMSVSKTLRLVWFLDTYQLKTNSLFPEFIEPPRFDIRRPDNRGRGHERHRTEVELLFVGVPSG